MKYISEIITRSLYLLVISFRYFNFDINSMAGIFTVDLLCIPIFNLNDLKNYTAKHLVVITFQTCTNIKGKNFGKVQIMRNWKKRK